MNIQRGRALLEWPEVPRRVTAFRPHAEAPSYVLANSLGVVSEPAIKPSENSDLVLIPTVTRRSIQLLSVSAVRPMFDAIEPASALTYYRGKPRSFWP